MSYGTPETLKGRETQTQQHEIKINMNRNTEHGFHALLPPPPAK